MSSPDLKNFQVYSASAGAGKTFSLVREYLILCLRFDSPSTFTRILAITFTIKAAAEMKSRVLLAIDGFRRNQVPASQRGLFNAVKEELGLDDADLRLRAEKTLKAMLHDYGGLGISTIDKFTYRLVRTFSHDLGLSTNFEVELDARELHKQSIDLLLDESGKNEKLTGLLERYIERELDDEKSWKIEYQLEKMAGHLGNEASYQVLDQLAEISLDEFIAIRFKLEKKRAQLVKPLEGLTDELAQLIKGIPDEYFSNKDLPNFLKKLKSAPLKALVVGVRLAKQVESGQFTAKSAKAEVKSAVEPITPALQDWFIRWYQFREPLNEAVYLDLVLHNYDGTAVLQEILRKLNEYKEANNVETLSAFNKLIHDSLEALPVPYIYERVGEKYRHYFIDEFQDTSVLQWNNLTPLVHNAVASGGTTMIVGDGKQSIYRWRGGEPEQFLSLIENAKDPANKGGDLSYALTHVSLDSNWRSGSEIVNFNNKLFGQLSAQLDSTTHQTLYAEGSQEPKGHEGGYVSLEFLEGKGAEFKNAVLRQTLLHVRECLADGFSPGDIAVLVRTKAEGELAVRILTENGISVVSVDSLKLSNSSAVRAIVGLIRWILFPNDVEARMELVEMLHQSGVWEANSENLHLGLFAAADLKSDQWNTWLDEIGLLNISERIHAAGLYEWGESAAREMGLLKDRKADPFVQFFLDEMYEFGARKGHNPNDFLQ